MAITHKSELVSSGCTGFGGCDMGDIGISAAKMQKEYG